jgi:large subunit ribosomal protein L32
MALKKRRRGPARTGHQRSAWMKKSGENRPLVQACPNCDAPRIPHRVCMACGFYDGQQVMKAKTADAGE